MVAVQDPSHTLWVDGSNNRALCGLSLHGLVVAHDYVRPGAGHSQSLLLSPGRAG